MICYNIVALWGSPCCWQQGVTVQLLKKCLHLGTCRAALLAAAVLLLTAGGRWVRAAETEKTEVTAEEAGTKRIIPKKVKKISGSLPDDRKRDWSPLNRCFAEIIGLESVL